MFVLVNQHASVTSDTKYYQQSIQYMLPAISHSCKRINVSGSQFITFNAKSTPMYVKLRKMYTRNKAMESISQCQKTLTKTNKNKR